MNKINEIKKTIRYACKKNIFVIIMIILLCPILAVSYSSFIVNTDTYRASEMFLGNLLYSIKINETSSNTITVEPGETEAVVEVTSLNTVSSNYKLVYGTNSNISVIYAIDENEPTYGLITNSKASSILITNTSTNNITVTFDIAGGYVTDELSNVLANSGYTEVSSNYMKYDYETIAMYVDNVRVTELDSSKIYALTSYTCTNNEIVNWTKSTNMASIYPLRKGTKCQLYFEESYMDVQNSYSCANGSVGSAPYTLTYTGNCTVTNVGTEWKVKFLTSCILILNEKLTVDAFLVGGGGGGSIQAGGGSGYTLTKYGVNLVNGENYNIVIGTGGSGTTEAVASSAGVSTTAFGFTANPGQGTPTYINGGAGGSGGGGGSALGGTNGDNGVCGGNNGTGGCYDGGLGQGVTTKEFFENDATLYASGGNGSSISTLQANSGNGGSKS